MKRFFIALAIIPVFTVQAQRFTENQDIVVLSPKVKVSQDAFMPVLDSDDPTKTDSFKATFFLQYDLTGINTATTDFNTAVRTGINRSQSWAFPLSDNELKYLQMLADVYEIHARKLRQAFNANRSDLQSRAKSLYDPINAQAKELEAKLNRETGLGGDYEAVDQWKETIQEMLNGLSGYATK